MPKILIFFSLKLIKISLFCKKNFFMKKRDISEILKDKILVLDGAMGTMIQNYNLNEKDFRGERFKNYHIDLQGNNDLLSINQKKIISEIHEEYLIAGADIIETNTFSANRISMSDYKMENLIYELNFSSAQIARKIADIYTKKNPEKPRFVAGSIGPTNKTTSISPDINNPAFRSVSFDEMVISYSEQVESLIDGGVDLLLIETIFDTLNAKACLFAVSEIFEKKNIKIPVMISGTIADKSGRTLSGQNLEAFLTSMSHFDLLSFGFNCAFGAKEMLPHIEHLSKISPFFVSAYPNAGFPNSFGDYDETPEIMGKELKKFLDKKIVNIIGGCCGTGPKHIKFFSDLVKNYSPRVLPKIEIQTQISGLENLTISEEKNFINIGERTNIAGSKKFAKLIRNKNYEKAIEIARKQVENGAQILDINMDDSLIDAKKEMKYFLNLLSSEPEIIKIPIMIDSSDFEVIESALKCLQGKSIVNSISLKDGEKLFIEKAKKIKKYGASVVVMAFDEKGQAMDFQRKIKILKRSYEILIKKVNFLPQDIIFDPNILTIGTGIKSHNNFAVEFLKATKWIKENLKFTKVSGGISNLSFAFRGNNFVREAMHTVFLFHARKFGLNMGIVNAGNLPIYDEIPKNLIFLLENLIFNRDENATEKILNFISENDKKKFPKKNKIDNWRDENLEFRLDFSLKNGIIEFLEIDINSALKKYSSALEIIEKPLMNGMNKIGKLFGEGKMFLPQIVKSARVMKKAVDILSPEIKKEKNNKKVSRKKILLATVKGDVHDIGKNILSVILSCNNYEIIDLGIMVNAEIIIETAKKEKVDIIGLSGLITPSLKEMEKVAHRMKEENFKIPLIIGGATTSKIHTAIKIAQIYDDNVFYISNASISSEILSNLLNPKKKKKFFEKNKENFKKLRENFFNKKDEFLSIEEARKNKFSINWKNFELKKPKFLGIKIFKNYDILEISKYINWTFFFNTWGIKGKIPKIFNHKDKGKEAKKLFSDAKNLLKKIIAENILQANAVIGFFNANSVDENVEIYEDENRKKNLNNFHFERNLRINKKVNLSLADFITPKNENKNDYLGFFALTTGLNIEKQISIFKKEKDDYSIILLKSIADRMAEAFSELLHLRVRKEFWAYSKNENLNLKELFSGKYFGIRPAVGYSACPDHSQKEEIFKLMQIEKNINIKLTENFAMLPNASASGFYFANEKSVFF